MGAEHVRLFQLKSNWHCFRSCAFYLRPTGSGWTSACLSSSVSAWRRRPTTTTKCSSLGPTRRSGRPSSRETCSSSSTSKALTGSLTLRRESVYVPKVKRLKQVTGYWCLLWHFMAYLLRKCDFLSWVLPRFYSRENPSCCCTLNFTLIMGW